MLPVLCNLSIKDDEAADVDGSGDYSLRLRLLVFRGPATDAIAAQPCRGCESSRNHNVDVWVRGIHP